MPSEMMHELRARCELELVQDRCHVTFYGPLANAQRIRDGPIGFAGADQHGDLLLALGQAAFSPSSTIYGIDLLQAMDVPCITDATVYL